MGVVSQRVCDLEDCAQPITKKTGLVYLMPADANGAPDLARRLEFESNTCGKNFLRGVDRVAKDGRIRKAIEAIPSNETGRADKVAKMAKAISNLSADAYAWPEAKNSEPEENGEEVAKAA